MFVLPEGSSGKEDGLAEHTQLRPTDENMSADGWTTEWPTEPGWYWAYGDPWPLKTLRECDVRLGMVKVRRIATGVMRVWDGAFLYEQSAAPGMRFMRAEPPEPPERTA